MTSPRVSRIQSLCAIAADYCAAVPAGHEGKRSSFSRITKDEPRHEPEARELAQTIKTQAQADAGQAKRQAQAAKLRAAQEREERIRAALEQLSEVAAAKKRNGGKCEDARARTADADARVMKMGDGGFRPAFNVQLATTREGQVIVGMEVVNAGSDMAQLVLMVEQVEQRLGQTPDGWLFDGGFPAHEQIDAVAGKTDVYAPVAEPRAKKDAKKKDEDKVEASNAQGIEVRTGTAQAAQAFIEGQIDVWAKVVRDNGIKGE